MTCLVRPFWWDCILLDWWECLLFYAAILISLDVCSLAVFGLHSSRPVGVLAFMSGYSCWSGGVRPCRKCVTRLKLYLVLCIKSIQVEYTGVHEY